MLGLIGQPADFPVLVRDGQGMGVIIAYLWKEVPFIALVVLEAMQSAGSAYEDSVRTLGADPWQRFRSITLPVLSYELFMSTDLRDRAFAMTPSVIMSTLVLVLVALYLVFMLPSVFILVFTSRYLSGRSSARPPHSR